VRIAERLEPTPLLPSPALGRRMLLKLETFQPTGSFKVRGALSALIAVEQSTRVVTASTGNHALGIAWASRTLGLDATVVCPETTSPAKVAALRALEASLVVHGTSSDEAEAYALALAAEGFRYVSAYNDPDVVAGQGTIALELAEALDPPLTIVCPVGGGGLAAGIGLWTSELPRVRVVGVQSEASPSMRAALDAGRIVPVPDRPTLADGLTGNLEPGSVTLELARRHLDDVVLVTEAEIAEAMRFLCREHGLVAEGAGASAVGATLAGRIDRCAGSLVTLVTGRNVALDVLARVIADA
jgi:threonine dehydratase